MRAAWTNRAAVGVLVVVSVFYAYGAAVHVANMLGWTGFDWRHAPLKWQALDVVYLVLDVIVAAGLWRAARSAVVAFFVAAVSQIALYTVGRSWILDVPANFAPAPDQIGYLDGLVAFHFVTLFAVSGALWLRGANRRAA
jgi:hypothetical protein